MRTETNNLWESDDFKKSAQSLVNKTTPTQMPDRVVAQQAPTTIPTGRDAAAAWLAKQPKTPTTPAYSGTGWNMPYYPATNEPSKATAIQFNTQPALVHGVRVGDPLYYTADGQYLSNKPTQYPARVSSTGDIVPTAPGERGVTLTDNLLGVLEKKAYLSPLAKWGDTLYMDLDETNWPILTNKASDKSTPLTYEDGSSVIYNAFTFEALTGEKPPVPKLGTDLEQGKAMYYDPVRNSFTSLITNFPVILRGGSYEVGTSTDTAISYHPYIGSILTGQIPQNETSVAATFKKGDTIYYDYATNQYTNKPSPTATKMYIVGDKKALLSEAGLTAGVYFTPEPNGNPAKFDDVTKALLFPISEEAKTSGIRYWQSAQDVGVSPAVEKAYQEALTPKPDESGVEKQYTFWQKLIGAQHATSYATKEMENGVVSVSNPEPWIDIKLPPWLAGVVGIGSITINDTPLTFISETALVVKQAIGRWAEATPEELAQKISYQNSPEKNNAVFKNAPDWIKRAFAIPTSSTPSKSDMEAAERMSQTRKQIAYSIPTVLEAFTSGVGWLIGKAVGYVPHLMVTNYQQFRTTGRGSILSQMSSGFSKDLVTALDGIEPGGFVRWLDNINDITDQYARSTYTTLWNTIKGGWDTDRLPGQENSPTAQLSDDTTFRQMVTQYGEDVAHKMAGERSKVLYEKAFAYREQRDEVNAKNAIMEAIHWERQSNGILDPYFAYTWLNDPARERSYLRMVADVIYQKGRPLTRQEILDLQNYKVDLGVEMPMEMTFDLMNLPIIAKAVTAPIEIVGKGLSVGLKTAGKGILAIPRVGPVVDRVVVKGIWGTATRSMANKYFQVAFNVAEKLTAPEHSAGWIGEGKTALNNINTVADVITRYRESIEMGVEFDLMGELRKAGLPRALDERTAQALVKLADVIPADEWGRLGERVFDRLIGEAMETASKSKNWAAIAEDLIAKGEIREDEIEALFQARRATSKLSDEALRKEVTESIAKTHYQSALTEEAQNMVTTSKFSGAFAGEFKKAHVANNLAWPGSKVLKGSMMGWVGSQFKEGSWQRRWIDAAAQMADSVTPLWVESVLARRPAWVVFNTIDNALRFVMATAELMMNPWEMFDTMFTDYAKMVEKLGGIPAETGMSIIREGLENTDSVSYRVISNPALAVPGLSFPMHYVHDLVQGYKAGGARKFFLWNMLRAFPEAIYDTNQAVEFASRLRLYYGTFMKNSQVLERTIFPKMLKDFENTLKENGITDPVELAKYKEWLTDLWKMAGNDPDKMKAIMNLQNFAKGTDVYSLWLSPAILKSNMFVNMADRQGFALGVVAEWQKFLAQNVNDLTPGKINEFWNGMLERFNDWSKDQFSKNKTTILSAISNRNSNQEILEASMNSMGMSRQAQRYLLDPTQLPDKWNPSIRGMFNNAFGKGDGISTKGMKSPKDALDALKVEYAKRLAKMSGVDDAGDTVVRLETENRLRVMEARADAVNTPDPVVRATGDRARQVRGNFETKVANLPAEKQAMGAAAHDHGLVWDDLDNLMTDQFGSLSYPGHRVVKEGTPEYAARKRAWNVMYSDVYNKRAAYIESLGSALDGDNVPDLTMQKYMDAHGWKITYDENGNIIRAQVPDPTNPNMMHTLSPTELDDFKGTFRVKTKADMEAPLKRSEMFRNNPAVQERVKFQNIKSLDDLRSASPKVNNLMREADDAEAGIVKGQPASVSPEQVKAKRRTANRAIVEEYNLTVSEGERITTATKSGADSDIPLVKTINKYLDLDGDKAYHSLSEIPSEDVFTALQTRWQIRNQFDIPVWSPDFREEMVATLQHQFNLKEKQADALMSMYEGVAEMWSKVYNKNPNEFWHTVFYGFYKDGTISDVWGSTEFVDRGRALIKAYGRADLNTAIHEMFHAMRGNPVDEKAISWLPPEITDVLDDWAIPMAKEKLGSKATAEDILREAMEIEAKGAVKYFKDGSAPSSKLAQAFDELKAWIGKIWMKLNGTYDFVLPAEVRKAYDRMYDASWVTADRPFPKSMGSIMPGDAPQSALLEVIPSEPAPVWYSQLQRTVEAIPQEKMSVEQAKALIQKNGVKADELKWTGIMDWLDGIQGGKVTKSEMLDFLNQNNVKVEEKLLGQPGVAPTLTWRKFNAGESWNGWVTTDGKYQIFQEKRGGKFNLDGEGYYDTLEEARDAAAQLEAKGGTPTRYDQYTLPGGQNYRELLFTWQSAGNMTGNKFYLSGHFSEPNILAHVRFDDRVDADGKRVLFIEEIQSDWHQAGREKGYVREFTELPDNYELVQGSNNYGHRRWTLKRDGNPVVYYEWGDKGVGGEPIYDYKAAERAALSDLSSDEEATGLVPEAPFAKSWPDMVMKRMIRWASENGYDRIAWTTGLQQTERYNKALQGQIDMIRWEKSDAGVSLVLMKNGSVVDTRDVADKALEATVGKEMAMTIRSSAENTGEIVGENIKISSEGMSGFYDVMLPSTVDKYVKKWGAKVGSIEIETGFGTVEPTWAVITHDTYENVPQRDWDIIKRFNDRWEADAYVTDHPNTMYLQVDERNPRLEQEHSFDITPQMRQSAMQGQPLFEKIQPSADLSEFWKSYRKVQKYQGTSLDDLFKMLFGEDVPMDDPLQALDEMLKLEQKYRDMGLADNADTVRSIHDEVSSAFDYFQKAIKNGDSYAVPPIPEWKLGENVQSWIAANRFSAAQYEEGRRLINDLRSSSLDAVKKNVWWAKQQPENVTKAFNDFADQAADAKSHVMSTAAWGDGTMEGAIPYTNRWMLDYSSYTNFDSFMRQLFPFWMFPSRSIPLWVSTFMSNPELPAAYFKYLQHSRRLALQAGATTSSGEQLPSLVGYVPLPGTDVWFNPTAPLSFRYIIPLNNGYYDEGEDATVTQHVATELLNATQSAGMYFSPILQFALAYMAGQSDRMFTSPLYEAVHTVVPFPLEMVPPFIQRAISEKLRKLISPNMPDMWKPEVSWKDYLIEREMLSDYYAKMQVLKPEDERKWQMAMEARKILSDPEREKNPIWVKYRKQVEDGDYYRSLSGYLTGFYLKELSPEWVEMMKLRDDLNNLRRSINDQIDAQVLDLLPDATDRYYEYIDQRYNTPEGWLWDGYTKIRWVTDEKGNSIYGMDRRQQIAAAFKLDQEVQDYNLARSNVYLEFDARMQAIPIGNSKNIDDLKSKTWEWLGTQLENLKTNANTTDKRIVKQWALGNKPDQLIEGHFVNEWWSEVNSTQPKYEDFKTYEEYQAAMAKWKKDLPLIAKAMMPSFEKYLESFVPDLQEGQTLENIPKLLTDQTNEKGYDRHKLSNDSIYDAMLDAWDTLYSGPYMNIVYDKDLTSAEKELQKRLFTDQFPNPPDEEAMWQYILKTYGEDKFTRAELHQAYVGKDVLTIQENLDYGKTDFQLLNNQVWNVLNWATSEGLTSKLYTAYSKSGKSYPTLSRDEADITTWYNTQTVEAWKDPEKAKLFVQRLTEAANALGYTGKEASTQQLEKSVTASNAKDEYEKAVAAKFGENALNTYNWYYAQDSKTQTEIKKTDPDTYALVRQIGNFKKQWEAEHPEMTLTPETGVGGGTSSGSSGGYSGGGYSGGGGSSGGKSGGSSSTTTKGATAGYRSTMNAQQLLAPGQLGKGGYGAKPKWPETLQAAVPPALLDEVTQLYQDGTPLTDAAIRYLQGLLARHPDWASAIQPVLEASLTSV